jgi:phosphohistidine phosphatase
MELLIMKHLYLMRHAKSSWKDSSLSDHQRHLNKRGKKAAPQMGELLNRRELIPDIILCSTAKRARATVDGLLESMDFEGETLHFDELYHADTLTYFDQLQKLPPSITTAMIVGHNPTMSHFINVVCHVYEHMPTAAIAHIAFDCDEWSVVSHDTDCTLKNIWRPRELG